MNLSVVLLAGGIGSRFGSSCPKQYVDLANKPLALYSYEFFSSLPEVSEIIVVCEPEKRALFPKASFAPPGKRRQDSAYNGFSQCDPSSSLIAFHDAARPFLSEEKVRTAIEAAKRDGAAALARPATYTIKKATKDAIVTETLDRSTLWLLNTPQIIQRPLLEKGFSLLEDEEETVTDDLALIEKFHSTSRLIEDWPYNLKITHPQDLLIAQHFLDVIACTSIS